MTWTGCILSKGMQIRNIKKKNQQNSVQAKQKHLRVKETEFVGHGVKNSLEIAKRASTAF